MYSHHEEYNNAVAFLISYIGTRWAVHVRPDTEGHRQFIGNTTVATMQRHTTTDPALAQRGQRAFPWRGMPVAEI